MANNIQWTFALLTKNMTQYIGPNKVVGLLKEEMKTPMGNEVVKVVYENHPSQYMTRKCFDLLVSETPPPGDYNYLQEKKFSILLPALIDLIMEYDLNYYEIGRLGQKLVDGLFERFHRASNFMWTGSDENYTPGFDFFNTRTVLDALKVISTIPPKEDGKSDSEQSGVGTAAESKPGESGETAS